MAKVMAVKISVGKIKLTLAEQTYPIKFCNQLLSISTAFKKLHHKFSQDQGNSGQIILDKIVHFQISQSN